MQLSPGQIISGAIFALLGAKMSQVFIESDNYSHISLVFANDLLGLLGLLGTAGLAAYKRKPWLAAGLALVIAFLGYLDFAREESALHPLYVLYERAYLPLTLLLVAVFLWRQRSWLRWPEPRSWARTALITLVGCLVAGLPSLPVMVHLLPLERSSERGLGLPLATLQQGLSGIEPDRQLLRPVLTAPASEELSRLGIHLLGVHPLANAALFAMAHEAANPAMVRQDVLNAAGSMFPDYPETGHKLLDTVTEGQVVQQLTLLRLLSFFIGGLLLYHLLIVTRSIWPPLVAHASINLVLLTLPRLL